MVNPTRLIAPVGSEVVLVGGLCGDDGYLITGQKIEWSLSQDSVGQFVDFSDRGELLDASKKLERRLRDHQHVDAAAKIVDARHAERDGRHRAAEGSVLDQPHVGQRRDELRDGRCAEGATWPQRRQVATIYWIDCQWAFPNPVAVPAGQPHTLSTHLTRTATNAPIAGWIVRYEVLDGSRPFSARTMRPRSKSARTTTGWATPRCNPPRIWPESLRCTSR